MKWSVMLLVLCMGCSTIQTLKPEQVPPFMCEGNRVVMYSKDLCPPCDTQEDILAKLAPDFPTIKFAKVKAYNALIMPTDEALVKSVGLKWTPTTVLYVDGHEVCRWVMLHWEQDIRPALEAVRDGKVKCTPDGCKVEGF